MRDQINSTIEPPITSGPNHNTFEDNRIGIAIEHGQNMNIALNRFTGDKTGIKLWSRAKQPDDWAYAKLRNTASMNYWIAANNFMNNAIAMDFMGTDTIVLQGNTKINVDENLVLGERTDNIDSSHEDEMLDLEYQPDERLKKIKSLRKLLARVLFGDAEQPVLNHLEYDLAEIRARVHPPRI